MGAGKTTIAGELVALSPAPLVYIEGDTFWSFIAKNAGKGGDARHKNFRITMAAVTAAALPYAAHGYEVILDFSIPPWWLDTARKMAKLRDVPIDYLVVCPSQQVCAAHAATRKEGKITDYSPYRDLDALRDELEANIISDNTADAATVAARIRKSINEESSAYSDFFIPTASGPLEAVK